MAVLGIEGTAHTLGVGIVDEAAPGRCRVRSNQRSMLRPQHGGIIPREAAHHHAELGPALVRRALDEAKVGFEDLEAVAFSQGPGLGPCLRVAATLARALALRAGVPLVGVNHCVAHLEIGRGMTDARDPVLLYASGANTQVIAHARGRYRVFGETLDIGVGNALDKFARDNGIPFPGGPEIERLAATVSGRNAANQAGVHATVDGTPGGAARDTGAAGRDGSADPYHPLPYTVKGMDLAFSGLALAAQRLVDDGVPLPEACHSFQETAFAALCEVTERALAHTGKEEVVLGGGVACNARLQEMARVMAESRGARFHCPPRGVLVDNGAMIAWLGLQQLRAGIATPIERSQVEPYQRTDMVEVAWR